MKSLDMQSGYALFTISSLDGRTCYTAADGILDLTALNNSMYFSSEFPTGDKFDAYAQTVCEYCAAIACLLPHLKVLHRQCIHYVHGVSAPSERHCYSLAEQYFKPLRCFVFILVRNAAALINVTHCARRLYYYYIISGWKDEWGYLSYLHDAILLYARGTLLANT
jgi:hypothetical protein